MIKRELEKALERGSRKKELVVEMSKVGILGGKRACPSTPSPSWRLNSDNYNECCCFKTPIRQFLSSGATTVSARKLGARLWELQQPHHPSVKICKPAAKSCLGREGDEGIKEVDDDASNFLDQPGTGSSLRKHVVASRPSVERNIGDAIQPTSPVSSMQMAPYTPAVICSNTSAHKRRMGDSFKTSSELLNVLTHILALEEQHASNMKIVKALRKEVDHSHAQIEELLAEKQIDRQAMNNLKQIAEGKFKCSERLHRKQGVELSRTKQSFSDVLKELEREREARIVLERLCDEFANGIWDYEKEVPTLRHKPTRARNIPNPATNGLEGNSLNRHSSESFPPNESISAPQDAADDGDVSCYSDSSSNEATNKLRVRGSETLGHDASKSQQDELMEKLAKSKGRQIKGNSSQARGLWEHKSTSLELNKFKSSLRLLQAVQENSLQAKLLEARLESRQQSSRSLR